MQPLRAVLLLTLAGTALAFTAEQHSADVADADASHGSKIIPMRRGSRYYDAVVVEAEGRAEGAGGASGALPQPLDAATCSLEPEQGPCRGYFQYFHYDAPALRCRRFTYSGCGGNANRFRTQKACEAGCGHLGLPGDKDKQLAAPLAEALAPPRSHSDADSVGVDAEDVEVDSVSASAAPQGHHGCSWGRAPACPKGCYVVNDATTDCPRCECSEETRRRVCSQPAVRGHCRALLTRWRYDPAGSDCVPFRFGGCDGNGNNFASRQQCLDACASPSHKGN